MSNMMSEKMQGFLSYQKALAYSRENQQDKAVIEINNALKKENNPLYLLAKGKMLAQSGKFKEAKEALNKINGSAAEKQEAEKVMKKIKQLEKPFGKISLFISNKKALSKSVTISLLVALGVSITLFFNERQKAVLNNNLNGIYQETEEISRQVGILNNLLEERELAEKKDLAEQKKFLLDSLSAKISMLEEKLLRINKSQVLQTKDLIIKIDTIEKSIESIKADKKEP